tara:strand:- start:94 stop:984 length:891 start_codon:yes stop_codon:yes gene_type:complete
MIIDLSKLSDGFSSKLRVISYFLTVIKIKKLKKELYIYEKKTIESPFLFTDLCLIKNFKIFKLKKKPKTNIVFTPYNDDLSLKKLKNENLISSKNDAKFQLISKLSYKNFEPTKKIKKNINKLNLPNNFIGIHIRSTDRVININNFLSKIQFPEMIFDFQINSMIKNLKNFINLKTKIKNIFVCSDDKFYKEKVLKTLNKNFNIYSNNSFYKVNNFRQTNGKDFLTELFCLSKSQMIISTVGGAVPNTALLISKKKIKFYKWTNIFNFFIFIKIFIIIIFYTKRIKSFLFNLFKFK